MSGFDSECNRSATDARDLRRAPGRERLPGGRPAGEADVQPGALDEEVDTPLVDGSSTPTVGSRRRSSRSSAESAPLRYLPERALRRVSDRMTIPGRRSSRGRLGGFRSSPSRATFVTVCDCASAASPAAIASCVRSRMSSASAPVKHCRGPHQPRDALGRRGWRDQPCHPDRHPGLRATDRGQGPPHRRRATRRRHGRVPGLT